MILLIFLGPMEGNMGKQEVKRASGGKLEYINT